ncbi:MAG: hypothetical protein HC840_10515 [Leptolyngbyaceae cyanobacterium RM2_2_4]|nr:hypothetical protein [Leptolyngbyaceae cyanobacterium RM2_2_4]
MRKTTVDFIIASTLFVGMICVVLGTLSWLGEHTPAMKKGIERCVIEGGC